MTAEAIDRLVASEEWYAVRRGVYAPRDVWDRADEWSGKPLIEARAASLNMVTPHVWSHDNSALAQGLVIPAMTPRLTHVTRIGVLGSRTRFGVKHHKAPFTASQLVMVDGFWMLDRARTAVDIAREHGLRGGLPACDSALRSGVSRRQLELALEPMAYWPHVTRSRSAVSLADPGAESVGESLTRLLVIELGLGPIETQFGLRDRGREAWCDLRVGRHLFEFDGAIKYRLEADGGVATRDPAEVLWREKQRQDFVCGFKLGMSRVVWVDLVPANWEATRRRIHREYLDTTARFGSSIDDLAPYIVRRRR